MQIMLPQFFDIHAHLNDERFNADRNVVLQRCREKNVWSIQTGTNLKSSQEVALLASFEEEGVFASVGVHPLDDRQENFQEHFFAELVGNSPRIVAIGECGVDYARLNDCADISQEKSRQKRLLEEQIDFAVTRNLPLMIHVRDSDKTLADAHRDVLDMLAVKKESAGARLRGNIHFFSQTIALAREYFTLGFSISFSGVITFSREYDEVVRLAPLDCIMSETDCPYAAPVPYRGKRNEPIFVEEVVKKIAEIRGEDYETVRAALVQNALKMFNVKNGISA